MSKLVIYTTGLELQGANRVFDLACQWNEQLDLSSRLGELVLVANRVGPDASSEFVALGRLAQVRNSHSSDASIRLDQVNLFPMPAATFDAPEQALVEITDEDFNDIIFRTSEISPLEESSALFQRTADSGVFMDQLGRQTDHRCALSGVYTGNAFATPIRPLDKGGRLHISNFLYLDQELSESFSNFHWTVGYELEIIINSHLMTLELRELINESGRLLAKWDRVDSPDPEALAWHRAEFFARIDGNRRP